MTTVLGQIFIVQNMKGTRFRKNLWGVTFLSMLSVLPHL